MRYEVEVKSKFNKDTLKLEYTVYLSYQRGRQRVLITENKEEAILKATELTEAIASSDNIIWRSTVDLHPVSGFIEATVAREPDPLVD